MEDFFVPYCSQELTNFPWLPKQFETYPRILEVSPETLNARCHFNVLLSERNQ